MGFELATIPVGKKEKIYKLAKIKGVDKEDPLSLLSFIETKAKRSDSPHFIIY
jgi:hypothetical protein